MQGGARSPGWPSTSLPSSTVSEHRAKLSGNSSRSHQHPQRRQSHSQDQDPSGVSGVFWQPVTCTSHTLGLHIEKQTKAIKVNQSYAIQKALQIATATKDISTASTNHKIKIAIVFLASTWSFWSFCLRLAANNALRTPSHSHFISRLKLKYSKNLHLYRAVKAKERITLAFGKFWIK